MIKELLKYLLPLCILLVDGVSNMYAGSQERPACMSSIQLLTASQHPNYIQVFNESNPAFRLPDAAHQFVECIKAISEEKEEDSSESSYSLKKQPRTGGIPTTFFAAKSNSPLSYFLKNPALRLFQVLFSSPRYLRLRVLRI